MKIIIPMAGKGKRMRPLTLTTPKPLIELAGKSIVLRVVEGLYEMSQEKISDIGFVISPDFGAETERLLLDSAEKINARGHIFYQQEALGTAHAVYCAAPLLHDKVLIAFADTLFRSKPMTRADADGIIWVKEVENPSSFGVVKLNEQGKVSAFIEKPSTPVSRLAIVGIYYFRQAENLKKEIELLLEKKLTERGEYQLTNALENLKNKGYGFVTEPLEEWLDCGNTEITLQTHKRILEMDQEKGASLIHSENLTDSIIIPPCYIGKGAVIEHSVIGPHVSVGENCKIKASLIRQSVLGPGCEINRCILENSMIGEHALMKGAEKKVSISAYSSVDI